MPLVCLRKTSLDDFSMDLGSSRSCRLLHPNMQAMKHAYPPARNYSKISSRHDSHFGNDKQTTACLRRNKQRKRWNIKLKTTTPVATRTRRSDYQKYQNRLEIANTSACVHVNAVRTWGIHRQWRQKGRLEGEIICRANLFGSSSGREPPDPFGGYCARPKNRSRQDRSNRWPSAVGAVALGRLICVDWASSARHHLPWQDGLLLETRPAEPEAECYTVASATIPSACGFFYVATVVLASGGTL